MNNPRVWGRLAIGLLIVIEAGILTAYMATHNFYGIGDMPALAQSLLALTIAVNALLAGAWWFFVEQYYT